MIVFFVYKNMTSLKKTNTAYIIYDEYGTVLNIFTDKTKALYRAIEYNRSNNKCYVKVKELEKAINSAYEKNEFNKL